MTRYLLRTTLEFIILAAFATAFLFWIAYLEGILI